MRVAKRLSSIWFRYVFTLPSTLTDVSLFSGIDDAGPIYVDGAEVRDVPCCASNGATTAPAELNSGQHLIAVSGRNTGGPGGLVANLTGDLAVVPLPAALPLLASGLLALGVLRARRNSSNATS